MAGSRYTGPGTILGGLPIIADVDWGADYWGEGYAEVAAIYWQKRDGTKGKPIPQKIWDRAEAYDSYFCSLVEQLQDHAAYEAGERPHDTSEMVQLFDEDHPNPNQSADALEAGDDTFMRPANR